MVVVLVVPCPLALRVWWSWHGVDMCGRLFAGWAAGLGCCGTVVVVGAGGDQWSVPMD